MLSDSEEWNDIRERNEDTESLYDMATGDLKEYIHSVRLKLGQVKHFQFMQGADMSRVSSAEDLNTVVIICSSSGHS